MTAPPNGHAERFERCFDGNYHDIARYCARRAATLEDAEDAATEAWRPTPATPPVCPPTMSGA